MMNWVTHSNAIRRKSSLPESYANRWTTDEIHRNSEKSLVLPHLKSVPLLRHSLRFSKLAAKTKNHPQALETSQTCQKKQEAGIHQEMGIEVDWSGLKQLKICLNFRNHASSSFIDLIRCDDSMGFRPSFGAMLLSNFFPTDSHSKERVIS